MTKARIYQPDKTATQSGKAKNSWLLEFAPEKPYFVDNLMGWTGMSDMLQEIRLFFATAEAAEAYAKHHNIPYDLYNPNPRRTIKKAYADNFRFDKRMG
ncbi:MAG: NADH dehydrogenase ubiquinone Fe-S protein 4 [Alphaproteobacteria bacterium]